AAHPQITTGSREPSRHHGVRSLGQTMGALLGIWDNGAGRQMFMTDDEEPKPPAGQDRDQTMSDLPDIEEPRGAYAAPETVSDVRDAARQPADEIEDTPPPGWAAPDSAPLQIPETESPAASPPPPTAAPPIPYGPSSGLPAPPLTP